MIAKLGTGTVSVLGQDVGNIIRLLKLQVCAVLRWAHACIGETVLDGTSTEHCRSPVRAPQIVRGVHLLSDMSNGQALTLLFPNLG